MWMVSSSSSDVQIVTQRVASVPIESVAPRVTPADEWSDEVALAARPSTASVRATQGTETLAAAVAVRDDGYLLTSGRALEGNTDVMIHTADGTITSAELIGYDPATDISVLKTDAKITPALIAAEPADEGDVVALVDPGGDSRRQVVIDQASASTAVDGDQLVGLLALDGTIGDLPPGSPVVDHTGAVIGITTATTQGVPVAVVPIALAADIADELIADGTSTHPRIGITARDLDDTDPSDLTGAYVLSTEANGPAELGGVQAGDLIIEIGGEPVESTGEMVAAVRRHEPGDTIEVVVQRDSRPVSCRVDLGVGNPSAG